MKSFMKNLRETKKVKILYIYAVAVLWLTLAAILGVLLGSTPIGIGDIFKAVFGGADGGPEARIFWYVRLPRTLAALFCGGALAVSGAVIQGVLANKLASPSIIGVNSGAGLAVTLCTAFGIYGGWRLSMFSFLGAFAAVMLVSLGAKKWGASRGTVILAGVALNSLLNAISDTVVTFSPEVGIMSNDFKVGDFSAVTYSKLVTAMIFIAIAMTLLFTLSNELDVLSLGEESARGLGMNTKTMRTVFLTLSAILAGCAVSVAGLLSFVGLIVPHAVRKIAGNSSKHLLPLCALFGAGFVALCDTVSRMVFAPYEIPVGIIMAFLGAPFFIFILIKKKGGKTS